MRRWMMGLTILAGSVALGQDDAEIASFLKKRTKAVQSEAGVRALVDDVAVYEGAGKAAVIDVIALPKLGGTRFLTVTVDGTEVVRLWLKSLGQPLSLPPTRLTAVGGFTSNSRDKIVRVQAGDAVIYEGAGAVAMPDLNRKSGDPYVVTVDGEVVYRVPVVAARQESGSAQASPQGQDKPPIDKEAILKRLNEHRRRAGLVDVTENPKLSASCQLHATYLAKNHGRQELQGRDAHREDPSLPGASDEGSMSGKRSVIGYFGTDDSAPRAIDGMIATLYHRPPLLNGKLRSVGIGASVLKSDGGVVVVDHSDRDWQSEPTKDPILCPAPDQVGVDLQFGCGMGEFPDPRPETSQPSGFPITVYCDGRAWIPGPSSGSLKAGNKEVECWLSCPDMPARKDQWQQGTVCLIPKRPLERATRYTVTVKFKRQTAPGKYLAEDWEHSWSFTTANE